MMPIGSVRKNVRRLLTLGYEGKTVDGFIGQLSESHVEVLVDVRELPLSRKRGFSKKALSQELAAAGIEYVHLRSLGSPGEARRRLDQDGDYEAFFHAYRSHLAHQGKALREVLSLLDRASVCLMCYEARADGCHRGVLAEELANSSERQVRVIHR